MARLTRTGLTEGQDVGDPVVGCDGVTPGVGVSEFLGPGLGEAESGVPGALGEGESLTVGLPDSTVSLLNGVAAGVSPPMPPEQPAKGMSMASAIAPTTRRARIMGEAYGSAGRLSALAVDPARAGSGQAASVGAVAVSSSATSPVSPARAARRPRVNT